MLQKHATLAVSATLSIAFWRNSYYNVPVSDSSIDKNNLFLQFCMMLFYDRLCCRTPRPNMSRHFLLEKSIIATHSLQQNFHERLMHTSSDTIFFSFKRKLLIYLFPLKAFIVLIVNYWERWRSHKTLTANLKNHSSKALAIRLCLSRERNEVKCLLSEFLPNPFF